MCWVGYADGDERFVGTGWNRLEPVVMGTSCGETRLPSVKCGASDRSLPRAPLGPQSPMARSLGAGPAAGTLCVFFSHRARDFGPGPGASPGSCAPAAPSLPTWCGDQWEGHRWEVVTLSVGFSHGMRWGSQPLLSPQGYPFLSRVFQMFGKQGLKFRTLFSPDRLFLGVAISP